MNKYLASAALLLAGFATAHAAWADATLDKIRQRGKLSVGIDGPSPPFGILDTATGKTGGYQTELAADLARRLGVQLETVPVTASTRVQFLQAGKVDLLVANIQWTQERSEILSFAPTPYDLVGGAAMVSRQSGIKRWEDLRGKVACVSQGSNFAKPLAEQYGAIVKGLRGIPESLLALKGGTCAASVHIQPALYQTLNGPNRAEWTAFALATEDQLIPSPTVVWTRRGEQDTVAFADKAIRDWHRTGFLLDQARKFGVPEGAYIRPAHDHARQGKFDVAPQDFAVFTEGRKS
ncbi:MULTISPECIES: transporter substrate-binding domain-containing protein [unclassified Cupriavidus]|uniref:transporter substrate-binding domain-containing protein n=1 Tax=unclassified Cupriavidus TaxID=2640874 RepID=UPI001C0020E5|nr:MULTISPECIES: transporter substrate-binding domain-containing protein [unclassified Cupriavidus]MCA3186414.1 transporter substrate-binding domain-containing protein [Cupriavidus sp.]MCA3191188.1 transporter substrate-binding domain-containing protein [Cupriavidus sp.]MCA3200252.1 transporter substrate-binding domain-containing protein [Cupriavidus sp.]MCA3205453.1 transporter substrate-binding domain-containing protein [Cupriavidus sp.]MCA3206691.1 transporter substrate-binding domain-conta